MEGGGEAHMFSAPLVVLPGLGIGALGRLVPVLYVVGLIMILIGGIGVLVRLGDWYRTGGRSLL